MVPNAVVLEKMVPNVCRKHTKTFFDGYIRKGLHDVCGRKSAGKSRTKTFRAILGKSGKNPVHPQKFTCSYTHALTNIPPPTCPKSNQLDHQLRHPVL